MKKLAQVMVFVGLAAATGVASAAATLMPNGTAVTSTECSILRDRVTVNISNGVTMGYNCNTTDLYIAVAACHTSGSQKPTEVDCAVTGTNADGTNVWNGDNCPAVATDPPTKTTIEGRRVFSGRSTGGVVAAGDLNSETCTLGALGAISNMQ